MFRIGLLLGYHITIENVINYLQNAFESTLMRALSRALAAFLCNGSCPLLPDLPNIKVKLVHS